MAKKMTKTIKKALVEQGMTVTDLAAAIKKSRVHTSRVVNDYFKRPPLGTVKLIANRLNIPIEDLELGEDKKRAA